MAIYYNYSKQTDQLINSIINSVVDLAYGKITLILIFSKVYFTAHDQDMYLKVFDTTLQQKGFIPSFQKLESWR